MNTALASSLFEISTSAQVVTVMLEPVDAVDRESPSQPTSIAVPGRTGMQCACLLTHTYNSACSSGSTGRALARAGICVPEVGTADLDLRGVDELRDRSESAIHEYTPRRCGGHEMCSEGIPRPSSSPQSCPCLSKVIACYKNPPVVPYPNLTTLGDQIHWISAPMIFARSIKAGSWRGLKMSGIISPMFMLVGRKACMLRSIFVAGDEREDPIRSSLNRTSWMGVRPSSVPHYLPLAESWTEAHKLQDLFVLQYPRSPAHPDRAARSSQFLRDTQRLIGQLACAHAIYLRRVAMIDQKADVDAIVAEAVASLSTDEYWRRGSTLCSSPGLPAPGDLFPPLQATPIRTRMMLQSRMAVDTMGGGTLVAGAMEVDGTIRAAAAASRAALLVVSDIWAVSPFDLPGASPLRPAFGDASPSFASSESIKTLRTDNAFGIEQDMYDKYIKTPPRKNNTTAW
ncbi:hypothetical protein B0H13DRAFT_1914196 [Mycena leptocephala]|nr:hypothetical protein B0H13DRAFT_1914196 [Mycena leptocephala]